MWIGKGLVIGVVASLAVGGGLVALEAASQAASTHLDDSPVTIPVGSIGDRVTYAVFERAGSSEDWKRRDDWGFEVAPVVDAPDSRGVIFPSVVVVTTPHGGGGYLGDVYPDLDKSSLQQVKNYKVSLAGRVIISRTYDYETSGEPSLFGTDQRVGANTAYGPELWRISKKGQYQEFAPDLGGWVQYVPLAYQGQTVQLGRDPGPLAHAVLAQEANNDAFEGAIGIPRFEYKAGVSDRRFVGPHDSYDLRSEGCAEFRNIPGSWTSVPGWGYENGTPFLRTEVPYGPEVCFQVDTWLSADVPYPVLVETQVWVGGAPHYARLESLVAFRPGVRLIPWDEAKTFNRPDYEPPSAERSGSGVRYPEEGADSRLEFGLTEALRLVESSPLLPTFAAWKATHADYLLAGYELTPREHGIMRWNFVYGTPAGAMFVVTIQKATGKPAEPPKEAGEFSALPLDLEGFEENAFTIREVDRLWTTAVQRGQSDHKPNWVRWGYDYSPPRVSCASPDNCKRSDARVLKLYEGYLIVGHSSDLQPAGVVDFQATPSTQSREDSYLVSWLPELSLVVSGHAQEFGQFQPLKGAGAPRTEPSETVVAPGSVPELGRAALVTSSVLAVFLALYFFPLVKQAGLEVALGIPGYAKLHKKELLNNQFRDRITSLVRAAPGITPSELQAAVGGSFNTIVYHLRVLQRNKMVSSLVDGRHKRFFPTEQVSWGERGRISALRNVKTRELYEVIHDQPGIAPKDLSRRVGLSRPTVYWHVDRLVRAGLVGHDKEAGRARFYASDPNFAAPARADAANLEVA